MKKTLLSLIFLALSSVLMNAQVANYSFTQASGSYTSITGGTVKVYGTADDSAFSALNIGFTFKFNGVNYTTFGLNTNGWIRMGSSAPVNTYLPLSAANSNTNIISAMGKDLQMGYTSTGNYTAGSKIITAVPSTAGFSVGDAFATATGFPAGTKVTAVGSTTITVNNAATSSGSAGTYTVKGTIRYGVIGTAPNRICVIQWTKARRFGTTATSGRNDFFNFQIRLHETSNVVKVVYGTYQTNSTSSSYQIGLRGNSTSDFNNRKTTTNWGATTAGTVSTSTCSLYSTVKPTSGLNYTWTPSNPSCNGMPTAGTVSSPTSVCSGSSFSMSVTGYTSNVSGITFQWQKSTSLNGTYTDITGATSTTYTALQTAATYYRCKVKCTNSGLTAITVAKLVAMNAPTACYCLPVCSDYYVFDGHVNFATINDTYGANTSTCNSYSTTPNPTLYKGVTYPLNIEAIALDGPSWAAWIDFNQNGVFETTERINLSTYINMDPEGLIGGMAGNVLIPSTAIVGPTRMRVRSMGSEDLANASACATNYGSATRDYLVTISNAPAMCSGTPSVGTVVSSVDWNNNAAYIGYQVYLSLTSYPSNVSGITFQWQKSTSLNGAYTNIVGATSPSCLVTTVAGNTYYRCKVTCTGSGSVSYSNKKLISGYSNPYEEGLTMNNSGNEKSSVLVNETPAQKSSLFKVYPNPATNLVNIEIVDETQASDVLVKIIDITGKEVFSINDVKESEYYNKQINTETFTKGLYYIQITTGDLVKTEKLLLQ